MGLEVPRDRWDRPLIVPPHGGPPVAYARASRFAETLTDSYALDQWHQHMVAIGIVENPWLANDVVKAYRPPDVEERGYDWKEMNRVCAIAQERAGATKKAKYGSDLHKLTERLDRGEDLGSMPREAFFDLAAYQETTEGVLWHSHIERFGVADDIQVGGTADRISRFDGWLPTGEWTDDYFVVDIKTGKVDGKGLQFGVQLGAYSRMQFYDLDRVGNPIRTPMYDVNQDWAIIVHLPKGEADCQLYWLNIAKGWEFAKLSVTVREARRTKELLVPLAV